MEDQGQSEKPALGARSREFLAERAAQRESGAAPASRPRYAVPAYEAKTRQVSLPGMLGALHLLFGVACGIMGAMTILAFSYRVEDGINPGGVIAGIGLMAYGGFCILLGLALSGGSPWARHTSLALAVFWAALLGYLGLARYPILLGLLPVPAATILGLRKMIAGR